MVITPTLEIGPIFIAGSGTSAVLYFPALLNVAGSTPGKVYPIPFIFSKPEFRSLMAVAFLSFLAAAFFAFSKY